MKNMRRRRKNKINAEKKPLKWEKQIFSFQLPIHNIDVLEKKLSFAELGKQVAINKLIFLVPTSLPLWFSPLKIDFSSLEYNTETESNSDQCKWIDAIPEGLLWA